MSKRVLKKKKKKKSLPIPVLALIVIVLIYLVLAAFFNNHFFPGTVIGDIKCGGKTPERVRELISSQSEHYQLSINGRGDKSDILKATDIDLQFLLDDTISEVSKAQNSMLWITCLWANANHPISMEVSYDEAKLERRLLNSVFFSASFENGLKQANIPNIDKTKEAVTSSIEALAEFLDLEEAGCYGDSVADAEDGAQANLDPFDAKVKEYTSARITYDWHGNTEVVDEALIDSWLIKDKASDSVKLDEAKVKDYIVSLSRKYDRFGSPRTFHTSKGEDIKISVVCYGWRVNRDKETEALINDIKNGAVVSREPEYLYTAFNKGEDDIGDSYVEIDLKNQHLYVYMNGNRVFESDFVSGNISRGFDTPDGIYPITYKERDATLNGQGYSSPVKYWMPFNGNVGMHDASWRKEFGGDIYLRNGSHGCVNLPTSSAEKIFGYVSKGFPVIVYGGDDGRKRLPQTQPEDQLTPGLEDGVPQVDPEVLLQMQQMQLLQQQQLQELQQQGVDPSQAAPPAGVDPSPEAQPTEAPPTEQPPEGQPQ